MTSGGAFCTSGSPPRRPGLVAHLPRVCCSRIERTVTSHCRIVVHNQYRTSETPLIILVVRVTVSDSPAPEITVPNWDFNPVNPVAEPKQYISHVPRSPAIRNARSFTRSLYHCRYLDSTQLRWPGKAQARRRVSACPVHINRFSSVA